MFLSPMFSRFFRELMNWWACAEVTFFRADVGVGKLELFDEF
jgi:hypothetical protein